MISARLLVAAAFVFSTVLFAQDTATNKFLVQDDSNLASISPSGPLTIDRLGSRWATGQQNPLLGFQATETPMFGLDQIAGIKISDTQRFGISHISPDLLADQYCLKIRSYQMARDSKNSDSTHLVGYSTCLPASKYRLRTAAGSTQPALSH
jgi:hypothetical protein